MAIETAHRVVVRQETVVSVAINALAPAAIIWFLDVPPPQTLLETQPIVRDMLAASGIATFMMTLVLTLIVRARVRKGALPALEWPHGERGLMAFIPQNLLLRALALGLTAVVLLVPPGLVIVALTGILPLTKLGFLAFNLAFGAVVGLVMARFVVLTALADPPRGQAV